MSVEPLLQSLLIHEVTNEANAPTQHEQPIDGTLFDVLESFLPEIKWEKID
jgi:hypothetical protein